MKNRILFKIAILSIVCSLNASEAISELDGMGDFESLLNEVSDIATKKSINVDYLPSVVSVTNAQTFIDVGIQNVGEALGMLPGIQMQMNILGQSVTNIRGFKNPRSMISDKIKILIDGVAVNNEAAATSGFYMDFPMHLVDKIEVLRGPGSTVYGAGAFYGAVNIITKLGNENEGNQLYLGAGSYKFSTSGANLYTSSGDWKILTDGYYAKNDKSITHDDKTTDEAMESLSLGFKVVNGDFEFLTRYKSSLYGNFYLYKDGVEPNNDKGHEDNYLFSQVSYQTSFNDYKLEAKLGYSNRESDTTGYFSTDTTSIASAFALVGVLDMQDAFYVRDHQVENTIEAEAILTLPTIFSNDISFGIGSKQANLSTNYFYSSVENAIAQNKDDIEDALALNLDIIDENFPFTKEKQESYWDNPTSNDLFDKTSRTINYAYIQDLISLSSSTDFVLGARMDDYSDIGTNLSSRAGLVYRASDEMILKLLYGSAFRAPSFYEAYTSGHIYYRHGVDTLSPEETKTYESSLIYLPDFNNKISLNIYYSELSNVIDVDKSDDTYIGYNNMKDRVNKGVEFEYSFRTKESHDLYVNATYTDAEYTTVKSPPIDQSMPDLSKVMLKAMYVYKPTTKLSFGTAWSYHSKTITNESANSDTSVEQQHLIDETITYNLSNSSHIILTVKNLFNEASKLPNYDYDGGSPREGRNYFLSYVQKF